MMQLHIDQNKFWTLNKQKNWLETSRTIPRTILWINPETITQTIPWSIPERNS